MSSAAALKSEPRLPIRDDPYNREVIKGVKLMSPRPAPRHALATGRLLSILSIYDHQLGPPQGPGGWWILFEPELEFGDDSVIPDLAGWRIAHLPELPQTATFHDPPDWVCEVLSPSSEKFDRVDKLEFYASHHVTHAWLVAPLTQVLEVYLLENSRYVRLGAFGSQQIVRVEPFDGIDLDLGKLWVPSLPSGK